MSAIADRTVTLDCDVLQADGGTRTASITAALRCPSTKRARACSWLATSRPWPVIDSVAAVSVGLVDDVPLLDLEYAEGQRRPGRHERRRHRQR